MSFVKVALGLQVDCLVGQTNAAFVPDDLKALLRTADVFKEEVNLSTTSGSTKPAARVGRNLLICERAMEASVQVDDAVDAAAIESALHRAERAAAGRRMSACVDAKGPAKPTNAAAVPVDQASPTGNETATLGVAVPDRSTYPQYAAAADEVSTSEEAAPDADPGSTESDEQGPDEQVSAVPATPGTPLPWFSPPPSCVDDRVLKVEPVCIITLTDGRRIVVGATRIDATSAVGRAFEEVVDPAQLTDGVLVASGLQVVAEADAR